MSENTKQDLDSIEALFVQSAHGVTTSNGSVTFHGLHTKPCSLLIDHNVL